MTKILSGLDKINNKIFVVVRYLVVACIALQVNIIFLGAIFRYFFNNPLTWVDEFSALLLVTITFLGCYLALSKNQIARIELFIGGFKGRAKKILYIVSELATLIMLIFIVNLGIRLFLLPTSLKQTTPGMGVPLWIFYALIPATFTLNILKTISKILHYIFDDKEVGNIC